MNVRRAVAIAFCSVALLTGAAPAALSTTTPPISPTQCSQADFNADPRLGPAILPSQGPVGQEVIRYNRLAGLTPDQFIATYWDPTLFMGMGGWRFPPFNGFLVGPDGQPIFTAVPVHDGQQIDRYGSEFGQFLAPAGEPYAQRALPPQSLDNQANPAGCNYHLYKVLKPFTVQGGPIAPGFGQRGQGQQYKLEPSLVPGAPTPLNVMWLLQNGYLERLI